MQSLRFAFYCLACSHVNSVIFFFLFCSIIDFLMVKQYYFKYCPFICIFKVSSLLSPSWPKHVAQSSKFCHPVDLSPRWHRSHSAAVKRGNFPVGQSQFCPRGAHCSRRRPLLSSSSFNGVQPALAQSSPPARDDWTHRATRRRPPTKQSQRRAVSSPAGRYVYRPAVDRVVARRKAYITSVTLCRSYCCAR